MKDYLTGLGATKVLTYDDLDDKAVAKSVTEWTGGKVRSPSPTRHIPLNSFTGYPPVAELRRRQDHHQDAPIPRGPRASGDLRRDVETTAARSPGCVDFQRHCVPRILAEPVVHGEEQRGTCEDEQRACQTDQPGKGSSYSVYYIGCYLSYFS